MGGIVSGITDTLFGSEPSQVSQVGTAQSPGQSWMQQLLMPGLQQMMGNYMGGGQGWQTPNMPSLPEFGQTPQAPFSSPMDMIQSGEMNAAQNLREQFYSGGGGGSAMGGVGGQGQVFDSNLAAQMAQGATGRFAQMQLPYDQMQFNQLGSIFNAGVGQQGMQYQAQNQAMDPRWLYGQFGGTYGSPMVDPGQQGLVSQLAPFAGMAGMSMIPGGFGNFFSGMFG